MSNVALTYNAEKHEYHLGGRKVPGVTTLLSLSGYFPSQGHYTVESRRRGTAVHRSCYLLDEHCPEATTVDEALEVLDLDERLIPYMQGYLDWKRESGFIPQRHEFQVCSAKLNIASTPDLYGGFTIGSGIYGVVELKTWKAAPPKCQRSAEIQTAAQTFIHSPAIVFCRQTQLGLDRATQHRTAILVHLVAFNLNTLRRTATGFYIGDREANVFQTQCTQRLEAEHVTHQ